MDKKPFPRSLLGLALLLLFGLGLAIRLYDLTDLPLDFHPTRQLFSAVKARGMYYQTRWDLPNWQRTLAIQQWKSKVTVEPEVMEHLAAFTYQYTGEQLWVPRLYSALFWLVGGVFLYLLARGLASTGGALLALAFYLFIPYGVFASRSFQPDPLMVMLLLAFWWLVYRWTDSAPAPDRRGKTWLFAILAGLVGGLAIYVKLTAAFFVIGGALGTALARFRLRDLLRNPQVWVMAALGALPGLSWALTSGLASNYLGEEVNSRFVPALLVSPSFYLQWQNKITMVTGSLGVALALLGLFFFREGRARIFLAGLWLSYLLFGLYFDYHISTHDYYSLPLIPIAALSLAGMGERFAAWAAQEVSETETGRGVAWRRGALVAVLLYGLFSVVWSVRNEMKAVDYRPQQAWWEEVGAALGRDASVAALTEDYGLRLAYWGWQEAAIWPSSGDVYLAQVRGGGRNFEAFFEKLAGKKAFFLVTDMEDYARQVELQTLLAGYPVYAQGEGYVIYDLQRPLEAQP
jgi:4-amino-4-deoxy-L-arabinose transferase-like glycosyltransferase